MAGLKMEMELYLTDGSTHVHTMQALAIGEFGGPEENRRAQMILRFHRELLEAKTMIPVEAGGAVHPRHVVRVVPLGVSGR